MKCQECMFISSNKIFRSTIIHSRGIGMKRKMIVKLLFVLSFIFLCGCAGKNESTGEVVSNPYFLEEDGTKYYDAVFEGNRACRVELLIDNMKEYENGTLYYLHVNEESLDNTFERWGNEPLSMGYIYICKEKIYFLNYITEEEVLLLTEDEITGKAYVVCQEESKEDALQEKGWHEYIVVDGDKCEYHGWNDLVETGWYQSFTWEKENGLVGFKCGFGAGRGHMELTLAE